MSETVSAKRRMTQIIAQ